MIPWVAGIIIIVGTVLFINRRLLYILYKTLPRDLRGGYRFVRFVTSFLFWIGKNETVPKVFSKLAKKHPQKVAFYFEGQEWTYQQLEEFSNKIANYYYKSQGYEKGDSVALLLENRPEYVGIWLGLSKIGVVTALINTNLVSSPLVHSIHAANVKGIIFGSSFCSAINQIKDELNNIKLYEFKDDENSATTETDLRQEMKKHPHSVPKNTSELSNRDNFLYIYTSGTTGLPKAAIVQHTRYMLTASATYYLIDLNPTDIFYSPLPLYHSAGGMIAAGQAVLYGIPVVMRKKFSASNYWLDCQKYNCTIAIYIGELCRYLLVTHKPGTKIQHKLKKMCGNGLRPQIWQQFKDTFGIEQIIEYYGATEGNSHMINMDGKVGAVGFIPIYARWLISSVLIKCDQATGEPIRNKDGLNIPCKPGEPGLLIGKINQKQIHKAFVGYLDKNATQKKVIRDVFVKGDAYFNTGDILLEDEFGYFYFKDRTGDTFRWKGENVATSEVEAMISNLVGYNDVVVYGVQVPNTEGRAGMAAIVDPNDTVELKDLARSLKSKLPGYAIPIFLRTMNSTQITGTFKLKKVDLRNDGFDVEKIKDGSVYILDSKQSEYIPLTKHIFDDVISGRFKL